MVLCAVPGGSCFSMMHCGRMRVPMLLVRHVARPDGALLCAVELLPDEAVRFPCRQLLPDGAVLCAVELLPDDAGAAFLAAVASRWCRIGFRGESPRNGSSGAATSSAQTSASLHPSRSASLAGSSHSRGTWASTVCAEEFPTPLEASFAILQPGRRHCSSKSPRGRILVLGTSGAHWPARWPRFELTERVAKSQLSGY